MGSTEKHIAAPVKARAPSDRAADYALIKPCIKRAVSAERRRCPIGLQKGFLSNVERFGRIPHVPHYQLNNLMLILDYQQVERRPIALLHPLYQRIISGPIADYALSPRNDGAAR